MITKFSYSFSELTVNPVDIAKLLGYPDGILPEPFDEYLFDAMKVAASVSDICGAIYRAKDLSFSEDKELIIVDGLEFKVGKIVTKELRNSETVFLFVSTAGKEISNLAQDLLMGDNPVLGYVYNVLGSVTVEAATDRIHEKVKEIVSISGDLITNRYSPGYCQWSVADQRNLFSFFPDKCCGISLTDSALMYPIKSVSGIIGVGKEVKFRKYTCALCSLTECIYRNRHKEK
jgi:hypothetical protein